MADAFNFDYGCVEICNNEYREKNAAFSCTVSEWKYLRVAFACLLEGLYTTVLPVEKLHSGIGIIGSQVK
jgi:hypothetical protein